MTKENTSGQHQETERDRATESSTSVHQQVQRTARATSSSTSKKSGRGSGKAKKPPIGGTAVQGAKSTLPKQVAATSNLNQQAEGNRDMRRRMQHLGTGPYSQDQKMQAMQKRREKRVERRKQRLEEQRQSLRKAVPGGKIALGRRNLYFLIAVVALVVALIVLFIVIKHPF